MRLVSIASGSSGNCIYVGSEHSHILVDAGISNKRIEQGLNEIGLKGSLPMSILTISRVWAFSPENIMCRFTEQRRLWRK